MISDEGTDIEIVTHSEFFRRILLYYKGLYEQEEYILNPKSIENRTDDIFNKKVSEKIKQLPVVGNGKSVGIISQ
ncbi:hypothetical protein MNBD_IGNAVI01-816 [hydrothermal vent metagenome]|uniref:Uncharacterized protein n=1 Tax=hydrothermal vent metagenome TaxID=652676 RepID=A0A3B1CSA0_9ZZZZ